MKKHLLEKSIFPRVLAVLLILSLLSVSGCTQTPAETDISTAADTGRVTAADTVTEAPAESETEAPAEEVKGVKIRPFEGTVYPYTANVKAYLEAGAGADVVQFMNGAADQHEDITVEWDFFGIDKVSYVTLEYSLNEDMSDAASITLMNTTVKRKLPNLYRAAKYYVRVTAVCDEGTFTDTSSFTTASLGPRVLNVGGLYGNVRDLGGYVTEDGHTVLQDKAFRGSSPDDCINADRIMFNSAGKKYLNNEVKIMTQLDLRAEGENCGRNTPAFDSAENYFQIPIVNFQGAFYPEMASAYRKVFQVFADESNYPIYFHCAAGADRTGTVAAILLALLGVDRTEIIQDFELTSFSKVGERPKSRIIPVLDGLEGYNGEKLSEKTANYLVSIGLTRQEIYNIKAIMLGLDPDGYTAEKTYELKIRDFRYSAAKGGDLKLDLIEEAEAASVSVDGKELPFTQSEKLLTVSGEDLKNVGKGSLTGAVTFKDGNSLKFHIIIDEEDITDGFRVMYKSGGSADSYYTYIMLSYPYKIFDNVEYHFHSRPEEFPHVEENILINGVSIKELNRQDMSKYTFSEFPGSSGMERYKVPVTAQCQGNTVMLMIHTGWLAKYAPDGDLNVTLKKELEFDNAGVHYYMSRDKSYKNVSTSFYEQ